MGITRHMLEVFFVVVGFMVGLENKGLIVVTVLHLGAAMGTLVEDWNKSHMNGNHK